MYGHRKILKKSFNSQLLHCLQRYRIKHKISFSKISAATGIPERYIRTAEHTGNMTWFELSKILYFHHKWIKVSLVNEHEFTPPDDADDVNPLDEGENACTPQDEELIGLPEGENKACPTEAGEAVGTVEGENKACFTEDGEAVGTVEGEKIIAATCDEEIIGASDDGESIVTPGDKEVNPIIAVKAEE